MIPGERRRLFGKPNPLDAVILGFLLVLAATVWYAVRVSRYLALEVSSVEPKRIVAGPGRYVMMKGTGFDQGTTIRVEGYPEQGNVYYDESTIGMEIAESVEPGLYRVTVRDGRGRTAHLPDALEVVWEPKISKVQPRILYNTGPGTRVDIFGKYLTRHCSVLVGDIELDIVGTHDPQHVVAELRQGPPLPLGEQPVTVINRGGPQSQPGAGLSAALERAVTVLPAPEVLIVEPRRPLNIGETVDLKIRGRNLREGMIVWSAQHRLGEATYVSPEELRIRVTARLEISGHPLILELPEGPKLSLLPNALEFGQSVPVWMVVQIFLDEKDREELEILRQLPEWRLKRPLAHLELPWTGRNFNRDTHVVEVLLKGYRQTDRKALGDWGVYYAGQPLRKGGTIEVAVHGQKLSGIIAAEPYAVFPYDRMENP